MKKIIQLITLVLLLLVVSSLSFAYCDMQICHIDYTPKARIRIPNEVNKEEESFTINVEKSYRNYTKEVDYKIIMLNKIINNKVNITTDGYYEVISIPTNIFKKFPEYLNRPPNAIEYIKIEF